MFRFQVYYFSHDHGPYPLTQYNFKSVQRLISSSTRLAPFARHEPSPRLTVLGWLFYRHSCKSLIEPNRLVISHQTDGIKVWQKLDRHYYRKYFHTHCIREQGNLLAYQVAEIVKRDKAIGQTQKGLPGVAKVDREPKLRKTVTMPSQGHIVKCLGLWLQCAGAKRPSRLIELILSAPILKFLPAPYEAKG